MRTPAKAATGSILCSQSTQSTAASLEGQIRAAREQLNDWVTCVSATTPKGQAEIRSLSAQISARSGTNETAWPAALGAVDTADRGQWQCGSLGVTSLQQAHSALLGQAS